MNASALSLIGRLRRAARAARAGWRGALDAAAGPGALAAGQKAEDQEGASELAASAQDAPMSARLVATVAHELRTPLAGILGMGQLLSETPLNAEQRNYLTQMRDSGAALSRLVDDLLDLSSLAAGRFELTAVPTEIRVLVEQVVEMLAYRAHAKSIEVASTVDASVPEHLLLDGARLRQILFNLVGNAVKFTRHGGVLVSVSFDQGALAIAVRDSGPGMSDGEQARLFKAFERGEAGRQTLDSSGLGLSIAWRIVAAFGGTLDVTSRLGEGSTFLLKLPCRPEGDATSQRDRTRLLVPSRVLVLAPEGPAREALLATIATLGGLCRSAARQDEAVAAWHALEEGGTVTDIIVDHRVAAVFHGLLADFPALGRVETRRTYLVNPEERIVRPLNRRDGYRSWLVRPLRERSLIEVLSGRMQGIEVRDAINDNQPVFRAAAPSSAGPSSLGRSPDGQGPATMSPPVANQDRPAGILVAEDDAVQGMLLSAMLRRAGHRVHLVTDAPSLLAALLPGAGLPVRPVLVLTDLNMPGGRGVELIRAIRARALTPDGRPLPLVVQTADSDAAVLAQLEAEGVSAVLAKPANADALALLLERLLDRPDR
ncbi:hypothetical protein BTR14_17470 [Rhizobium rhizosphaerae]|uniref:histidine kinase n=1 Tax=Xaviernesmea rhizosphaerae TaxID=1672749 RepID=A0ABX3PAL3_9HYPH|nr:ATP-binding protein [Xaviernesmea rhizosphaerae]OQP84900.1 hypothetical protein BTR14_17470 [Xaviernesmea rhizosphaerae]